jgi:U3 small nucleolar RNA-associated protein 18
MGKRTNKRQKLRVKEVEPLGVHNVTNFLDNSNKDDEERRLESMLFGTSYAPSASNKHVLVVSDDEDDDALGGGTEFQTVLDTDVRPYFVR